MRWLFIKREETDEYIRYSYSRESSAEGTIIYDKLRKESRMEKLCGIDETDWDISKALGKFESCVVREAFPVKRLVVIG